MPLTFSSIEFLFSPLRKRDKASLDVLPNDVIVDNVFDYLDVDDILRMRRTSRVYYFLSQHSIVWKRLIRRTTLPLPPFPPTSTKSLHELSASEAERLMARAAAVDRLWKLSPQMCEYRHFDSPWSIEEMKLLPGSHYLVASATDATRTQWGLVLYMLDAHSDSIPIARMPTKSKAFNLDVKYMTLDGVPGITVTFIRRAYINSRQRKYGPNINNFSGDHHIDFQGPVKHECQVVHISLPSIEMFTNCGLEPGTPEFMELTKSQPPPFRWVCKVRTDSSRLGYPSINVLHGIPTVTVIRYPDLLWIFPIVANVGGQVRIRLARHEEWQRHTHTIQAVRVLPEQRQVIVARTVDQDRDPTDPAITTLELHDVPAITPGESRDHTSTSKEFYCISNLDYREVRISEPAVGNWIMNTAKPDQPEGDDATKPSPIQIYLTAGWRQPGLSRLTLYPHRAHHWRPPSPETDPLPEDEGAPAKKPSHPESYWRYDFEPGHRSRLRWLKSFEGRRHRVITGPFRTILFTVPSKDLTDKPVMIDLWRYHERDMLQHYTAERDPEEIEPSNWLQEIKTDLQPERIRAMAWDDTVGRLYIARPNDASLVALDVACRPKEDPLHRDDLESVAPNEEPMSIDDYDDYVCERMLICDVVEYPTGKYGMRPRSPAPTKFYAPAYDDDDDEDYCIDSDDPEDGIGQHLQLRLPPARYF